MHRNFQLSNSFHAQNVKVVHYADPYWHESTKYSPCTKAFELPEQYSLLESLIHCGTPKMMQQDSYLNPIM